MDMQQLTGRALDAEVARRVLGLRVIADWPGYWHEGFNPSNRHPRYTQDSIDSERDYVYTNKRTHIPDRWKRRVRPKRRYWNVWNWYQHTSHWRSLHRQYNDSWLSQNWPPASWVDVVPRYSSDAAAVQAVEVAIGARGDRAVNDYLWNLWLLLYPSDATHIECSGPNNEQLFALLRATPEQRCRAALKAVEVAG